MNHAVDVGFPEMLEVEGRVPMDPAPPAKPPEGRIEIWNPDMEAAAGAKLPRQACERVGGVHEVLDHMADENIVHRPHLFREIFERPRP
jgi:hypothetical protein